MPLRSKTDTTERDELIAEIQGLRADIAGLRKTRDAETKASNLASEIEGLKATIVDLGIEKSKLDEQHARETREVEHKVGLQKKRADFEQESAKREATLAVREENLAADKDRLKEQVEFLQGRFEAEVGYLKELMGEVLHRLPDVQIEGTLPAKRTARSR